MKLQSTPYTSSQLYGNFGMSGPESFGIRICSMLQTLLKSRCFMPVSLVVRKGWVVTIFTFLHQI
jgi:hypothetical protein